MGKKKKSGNKNDGDGSPEEKGDATEKGFFQQVAEDASNLVDQVFGGSPNSEAKKKELTAKNLEEIDTHPSKKRKKKKRSYSYAHGGMLSLKKFRKDGCK